MDDIDLSPTEPELAVEADISTEPDIAADPVEAASAPVEELTDALNEPGDELAA
jgi:hypothetical protein